MNPTLLDAALGYAARHWRVHPLHHPTITAKGARCSCPRGYGCPDKQKGKHPRLGEWPDQATTDPDTIRAWWKKWPSANIGIVTGPGSGLAVLDIDPRNGGDITLAQLTAQHGELPDTPSVLSGGGGQHYDFLLTDDLPSLKLEGIDFLTAGHYVIAPPSLHSSGQRYTWELSSEPDNVPLATIPDWLRRLVETTAQAYTAAASTLPDDLPSVDLETLRISTTIKTVITRGNKRTDPYPSRSEALFAVETSLIRAGYDDATIAAILLNPQYGISDKPLHQKDPRAAQYWTLTKGWIARDIARARAKVAAAAAQDTAPRDAPRMWQTSPNGQTPPPVEASPPVILPTEGLGYQDWYNARALVAYYGAHLRYCYAWEKWLAWTGTHWALATSEPLAWAKQTIKRLASQVEHLHDEDAIAALLKHITGSLRASRLQALLTLAPSEPHMAVLHTALDTHPFLLNCQNGTVDLRTGALRPHRREDFLTTCLPIDYDAQAACSLWKSFLWRIFAQQQPLIDFVQKVIGYCLTGSVQEQALFVFWGTGANGKSTLVNTLLGLFGAFSMKATEELLMVTKSDRHPTERADLFGKRLVATIETRQGSQLNEVFVKEATGGDPIRARRMREDFWQFDPTHKFILATNHKPVIRGTDHAIWRRIHLVPFTVTIPDTEKNPHLLEELHAEWPGILAWAVRGCQRWLSEGLGIPAEVAQATATYRQEMDVLEIFLTEQCVRHAEAKVRSSALYAAYRTWCDQEGETLLTQTAFSRLLVEKGYEKYPNNGIWWRRIGLPAREESRRTPDDD